MLHQPAVSKRLGSGFWTLLSASGLSNLADGVFKVALPLVAVTTTRSPILVAGLEVVRSSPWLLFALPAGVFTDRWNRRTTMVLADAARAGLLLLAGVLLAVDGLSLWMLFPIALGTGVAEVFHDTAAQTILPSVVHHQLLPRANGRLSATEQTTQLFLGPPLGAALLGLTAWLAFGAPALLWIVAAGVLATLRGRFRPAIPASADDDLHTGKGVLGSIRADVATGLRYLRQHPVLRRWAAIAAIGNLCISATLSLLVLRVVGDAPALGLGERGYAILTVAVAVGSVAATFVVERIIAGVGRARTVTLGLVGLLALVAAPGLSDNAIVIWVFLFIGGVGNTLFNVTTLSYRQEATPEHLLGRVNSTFRFLGWGTIPIGAVLGGLVGELVSVRAVFLIGGALFAACVFLINRPLSDDVLAESLERVDG